MMCSRSRKLKGPESQEPTRFVHAAMCIVAGNHRDAESICRNTTNLPQRGA